MKEIRFVQTGTASIVGLGLALIICSVLTFVAGAESSVAGIILFIASLLMLICLLTFYKMEVGVTDEKLYFKMGIGFFGRSYPLNTIASCKFVKSSPLYGIGIRMLPNGWMYTVSGFNTIELTFKNSTHKIRIGSDKAETIAAIVNERIGTTEPGAEENPVTRKRFILLWSVVVAVAVIPILFVILSSHDSNVVLSSNHISIKGSYGFDIPYNEILSIDTITVLPKIKIRTNGLATGKYLKGNFRLQDKTDVKLFIRKRHAPYLHISTSEVNVYLNSSEQGKVKLWYIEISERMRE